MSEGADGTDGGADTEAKTETESETVAPDPEPDTLLVTERPTPEGLLVAVCDAAVLGESLATADGEVSIDVTESFYGGEPRDRAGTVDALGRADVANLVGTRAVTVAVEVGLVDPANVLDLDGTPHAQFMQL